MSPKEVVGFAENMLTNVIAGSCWYQGCQLQELTPNSPGTMWAEVRWKPLLSKDNCSPEAHAWEHVPIPTQFSAFSSITGLTNHFPCQNSNDN